jgi:hypothetical protein
MKMLNPVSRLLSWAYKIGGYETEKGRVLVLLWMFSDRSMTIYTYINIRDLNTKTFISRGDRRIEIDPFLKALKNIQ